MKWASIALLAGLMTAASGCLVVDDDGLDCYGENCGGGGIGDMGFWWSFELADGSVTDNCLLAGVARVDVEVYDDWGDLEYAVLDRPCNDLGLDLFDFLSGRYGIQLTARCELGSVTQEGWFDVYVEPGQLNDYGVLVLDYVGPCE